MKLLIEINLFPKNYPYGLTSSQVVTMLHTTFRTPEEFTKFLADGIPGDMSINGNICGSIKVEE